MVAELEGRFAEIAGVRHAVAVSNGTVALEVSLEALRHLEVVRAGDEVLTSAFTFVATANTIVHAGLTARFADIGQDYCLDPAVVTERLTDRTRVLLPVHLYGLPADMTALEQLVRERGLFVVEDAAQALGATVGERAVGSYGLGCFSLYATKNVTSGEGGMITTDSDELAELLRLLRNQGMRDRYEYLVVGHNHRMTDLQAAVALGQLGRFEATNAARRRNAERLSAALAGLPGLVPPAEPAGRRSVWHQFTVRVTEEAALGRDELATAPSRARDRQRRLLPSRRVRLRLLRRPSAGGARPGAADRDRCRTGALAAGAPARRRRRHRSHRHRPQAAARCLTSPSSAPGSWAPITVVCSA